MQKQIGVFLVDDNEDFVSSLKERLQAVIPGVDFQIECHKEFIPDLSGCEVFLVNKKTATEAKRVIKEIKECTDSPNIFVITDHEDFELIQEIFNNKISGFLDKSNLDVSHIINLSTKTTLKERLSRIAKKASHLKLCTDRL